MNFSLGKSKSWVLRRGGGCHRRRFEGRSAPFTEYDPLCVHPNSARTTLIQREDFNLDLCRHSSNRVWVHDPLPQLRVDGLWIVSLEAPKQKLLAYKSSLVSIDILASKSSHADQCRALREITEKKYSKISVDFGPQGGVDLAWIIWGREKRAEKIRGGFGTEFATKFVTTLVTKFVPVSGKIRDRIRVAISKIHRELPPYFCVLSSRTERTPENALSTQGKGRTNKTLWAKENRK